MTEQVENIIEELRSMGSDKSKTILMRHGAQEPFFGVKVGDLKKILKREKKNHPLALALYETGNSDAMYLAGLMADAQTMRKEDLDRWAHQAYWYMLSEYTVGQLAAETPHAWTIGKEWINSSEEMVATAGWSALANYISMCPNEELPLEEIQAYLTQIAEGIHEAPNRVRYVMNGFVIALGCSVLPLHTMALEVAEKIGKVSVNMGSTACKVPVATEFIQKVVKMGRLGRKKKYARC